MPKARSGAAGQQRATAFKKPSSVPLTEKSTLEKKLSPTMVTMTPANVTVVANIVNKISPVNDTTATADNISDGDDA
ncbi:hypothetical protein NDU88_005551 [Pleurodeles waltl]|uniref:Uncharacterized protein n=1 Tax=Pleurodeles waltl TaxID=8319 RepID=A0AAV7MCF3_PLEWA|nr:hypothetical protein NDU88_005551 [Pleurodeles waltl]